MFKYVQVEQKCEYVWCNQLLKINWMKCWKIETTTTAAAVVAAATVATVEGFSAVQQRQQPDWWARCCMRWVKNKKRRNIDWKRLRLVVWRPFVYGKRWTMQRVEEYVRLCTKVLLDPSAAAVPLRKVDSSIGEFVEVMNELCDTFGKWRLR